MEDRDDEDFTHYDRYGNFNMEYTATFQKEYGELNFRYIYSKKPEKNKRKNIHK